MIAVIGVCLFRIVWLATVFPVNPTLETIFVSYPITWIIALTTAFTIIQVLLKDILKKKALAEQNIVE